jgi:hypothetical protein
MVGALLLVPRTAETCHRLGAAVDYVYDATVDHRRYGRPPDPLELADRRMLGWRITVALHVVRDEELRAARERSAR